MSASNSPNQATRTPREEESASGLLSRLLSDASALIRNEVALAKTEAANTIAGMKVGVAAVAIASAVLLGAFLTFIAGIVMAVSTLVEPWIAAMIVSAILALVGFAMLQAAKRKFGNPVALNRTKDSIQRDADVVARRT